MIYIHKEKLTKEKIKNSYGKLWNHRSRKNKKRNIIRMRCREDNFK